MVNDINRIEKALEVYEDTLWYLRQIWTVARKDLTQLPEPTALREKLSKGEPAKPLIDSLTKVIEGHDSSSSDGQILQIVWQSAIDIADWVENSKRIFHLSKSLTEMLIETDLPEFTPDEVKFVAPVFAIKLEEPIITSTGRAHDFLVFINVQTGDEDQAVMVSIRSYHPTFDDYRRVSPGERKRVEELARTSPRRFRRHWPKIKKVFDHSDYTGFTYFCPNTLSYNVVLDRDIVTSVEVEDREVLFRIAFGLNLYLQSSRKGDIESRTVNRPKKSDRGCSVMNGADLFELNVSRSFSRSKPEDSEANSGSEVRPHFRRGHWRRPKGYGQDPEALATEWVRPTWVRRDKIEEGVQPVGSLQKTI